ncbi:MAG: hypothetical protein MUE61_09230 [Vicinamibacterales bacterium]|nr:hypothetical protein [Vicinamibacterales bacterium]
MIVDRRVASGCVVLILAWLAAAVSLAVILVSGGGTDRFGAVRAAIHAACVAALLWYLARSGPSMASLPASPLGPAADGRAGRIAAAAAAVVFVRRDWEHAVGAHYATNFAPWVMALLAR